TVWSGANGYDIQESPRVKTGTPDEEAVDVALGDQAGGIVRRHRPPVEDRRRLGLPLSQRLREGGAEEPMHLLRRLGGGGLAGADRPYRLIGQGEAIGTASGGGAQLPRQHLESPLRHPLLARLADADERQQAVPRGGRGLARHQLVALAMVAAPLAVPAEGPEAAGIDELRGRDVAGMRPPLVRVKVLTAHRPLGVGELGGDRRQEGERGEEDDLHLRPGQASPQRPAIGDALAPQEVHLPVGRHERQPPALGARGHCGPRGRSRAATPGRTLPARNSSDAPPPVETWPMRSRTPAWRAAATVSPPPMTEK